MKTKFILAVLASLVLLTPGSQCQAFTLAGTAFTYQGRLNDATGPVTGTYDLTFAVYDSSISPGTLIAGPVTNSATGVTNGLFTVTLDFGTNIFNLTDRWLEVGVRTNGAAAFATLSPRQHVTATPYAIAAINAGVLLGQLPASQLSGTLSPSQLPSGVLTNNQAGVTLSGSFTGNGGGLTNASAWQISGNAGTSAGPNFLGTSDNQPLEIHVNGFRALRIEPAGSASPSFVGGYYQNTSHGAEGAVIAGGGASGSINQTVGDYAFIGAGYGAQAGSLSAIVDGAYNVASGQYSFVGAGLQDTNLANYSFIGGGSNNVIGTGSDCSTLAGGQLNTVNAPYSTVGGGYQNTAAGDDTVVGGGVNNSNSAFSSVIGGGADNLADGNAVVVAGGSENHASTDHSTVGGGQDNVSSNDYATVAGGDGNSVSGFGATVGGGLGNTIQADANSSTIGGGTGNTIQTNASVSTISGGYENTIQTNVVDSAIGGGGQNTILANAYAATVPGGFGNFAAGTYSFAAGQQAQALHQGAFVWADSEYAPFASTTNDQFNVRAQGGVRLVTSGAGITVDGQPLISSSGTIPDTRLSTNVAFLNTTSQSFSGVQTINGPLFLNSAVGFDQSSIGDFYIDAPFVTGGRFTVLPNGNVGIGTNSPLTALHVSAPNDVEISIQSMDPAGHRYTLQSSDDHSGGLSASFQIIDRTLGLARMVVLTNGNIGIGTSAPTNRLHVIGGVSATAFVTTSDRNAKTNFARVSPAEVLSKVVALPISTWNFKDLPDGRHMGPMAQDFYAAFHLGCSDTTITTVDPDGVALAAIQGLNEKLDARNAEIQELKQQNLALEKRLDDLAQAIKLLTLSK